MVQGFLEFPKNKIAFSEYKKHGIWVWWLKRGEYFLLYFSRLSNSSDDKKINESVLGKEV